MSRFMNSLKTATSNVTESISTGVKSIYKGDIFGLIDIGNYEGLILHLKEYPKDIEAKNKNKYTPLTYAYLADMRNISGPPETRSDIIQLLVDHGGLNERNGPIIIDSKNNVVLQSSTPLLFAIVTKNDKMTKDLIKRGADVTDNGNVSEVIKNIVDVVKYDSNIDSDDYIEDGTRISLQTTPLIESIEADNAKITTMLLEKMTPDGINQRVESYRESAVSALKLSFIFKKPDFILLLIRYGADVIEVDEVTGDTYLHDAINNKFPLYVVEALIKKYPDIVNKVNKKRQNKSFYKDRYDIKIPPLVDACRSKSFPLIELLLENGADPNQMHTHIYDNHITNTSPLIDAVFNLDLPLAKLLLKYNKTPLNNIIITHNIGSANPREIRLLDNFTIVYFRTNSSNYNSDNIEDKLNMLSLLLEHGATKNKNFDYRDVHPSIIKILTYYQYSLSVASLQEIGVYPHLDVDSQKQLADYIVEDQPDDVPQYWKDNNNKVDYIEENIKNMKTEEMRLNASYRFKKFLDESRFKSQKYYNAGLNEIYNYVKENQKPKNSLKGGKKTRRTASGKSKTPHGKAKTPHGKSKTRRYKKA